MMRKSRTLLVLFFLLAGGCHRSTSENDDAGGKSGPKDASAFDGSGTDLDADADTDSDSDADADAGEDSGQENYWAKSFGDELYQGVRSMALDSEENVWITGSFEGSVDFGGGELNSNGESDIYVAKFDRHGEHLFSRRFGDEGSEQRSICILVNQDGGYYLAGEFEGSLNFGSDTIVSAGDEDIFVAKFDRDNKPLWVNRYGDDKSQDLYSCTIDEEDSLILTGIYRGFIDIGDEVSEARARQSLYVMKIDKEGNGVWINSYGDDQKDAIEPIWFDTNSSESIVVSGVFSGDVDFGEGYYECDWYENQDMFILKLDDEGKHVWSKHIGDELSGARPHTIAVDHKGDVILAGGFVGNVDFGGGGVETDNEEGDFFFVKYNSDGDHVWTRTAEARGESTCITSVDITTEGGFFIFGRFNDSIDLGGGLIENLGYSDIFIAEFDRNGSYILSESFGYGSKSGQYSTSLQLSSDNSVYFTGDFYGYIRINNNYIKSNGEHDIFLAMLPCELLR